MNSISEMMKAESVCHLEKHEQFVVMTLIVVSSFSSLYLIKKNCYSQARKDAHLDDIDKWYSSREQVRATSFYTPFV